MFPSLCSRFVQTHHHEMEPMAKPTNNPPGAKAGTPTVSRCLPDGTLIELLYDSEARTTAFAVTRAGRWTIQHEVRVSGERLVPFSPANNLIKNEAVLLPSRPQEYGSERELVGSVQAHIHRYADLSAAFGYLLRPPDLGL
jgi:hypothetical protein